jgi:hypothetical protein
MILESVDGGAIFGVRHAEVVGVKDEQARIGGIAEALGDGFERRILRVHHCGTTEKYEGGECDYFSHRLELQM